MTHDIILNREKAIEIIEFYIYRGQEYYKIEKFLIDKGIVEDCGIPSSVQDSIDNASNELLTELLQLI